MTQNSMNGEREFKADSAVGHATPRAGLYEGHGARTSTLRMQKGQDLGPYRHDNWIRVFALTGRRYCSLGDRACVLGDTYSVESRDEQVEIGFEENTEVLLIKAMPNLQYPIEAIQN